jgi:hypothetical protein
MMRIYNCSERIDKGENMNNNSKVLTFVAVVLGLVILGSEVWERKANSGETLLNPANMPQVNVTPNEKPVPDGSDSDEEAIPDESPEVQPQPINPQQPKRRFVIPRRSGGGCNPGVSGGGCSPGEEIYGGISYPSYSYSYSYGRCR